MSESSKPEHAKAGSSSHRRRSRAQPGSSQRPSGQPPPQPPGYSISSSSSAENIHNHPPTAFQGSSIHYPPATVPYNQRGGYVGQYTMSAQPSPMSMAHSPPSYAFTQYHHPVVPDNNNMISQNIHASYQSMLQPQAPVFPYQRHSPEGSSTAHGSFTGTRHSPMYSPHQHSSSSPTSPHLPSSSGQSSSLSPSYVAPNPFHSLQYPSPMSTPQYPYPTQTYPQSPMYQAQFAPSPFGQHYTSTGETEPQGTWYYLPHPPHGQQYDAGPSYQGHYTVGYPQSGQSGVDANYGRGGQSSSANPVRSSPHPVPTAQLYSSRYSDNRTPSDSPHASGGGPPSQAPGIGVPTAPSASSGSGRQAQSDRPVIRRSYHPNPPAHRSEWVMWAGNVPSDASHDELWRFFNQSPEELGDSDATSGVLSIFLISRSSCAFVNYESELFLQQAIARFNGVPLRPGDSRCPRLVCRVRRKDDDLKAGVGGQRGMGMHTKWIREKGKAREVATSDPSDLSSDPSISPTSVSERLANAVSNMSMSSDEDGKKGLDVKHSSSTASYASTNSSFLTRHFPKRYFILKSLTQEDLDTSVGRGVWATQKHNEEILDQAYRTSQEVHLIFSVNKSGEFYGYARMAGPVRRGEQRVPWASRPPQTSPPSRLSQNLTASPIRTVFPPGDHRFVETSPLPLDGIATVSKGTPGLSNLRHSAPALLGEGYHLPTLKTPTAKHSLDQGKRFQVDLRGVSGQEGFELDVSAPARAMRANQGLGSGSNSSSGSSEGQDKPSTRASGHPLLHVVEEEEERVEEEHEGEHVVEEPGVQAPEKTKGEEAWGDSFAVEWICTDRLPFHRTKHLRNPWNHDREIKISRDGTELEPTVGQRLLEEWGRLSEPQPLPTTPPERPASGKRAMGAKSLPLRLLDGHHEESKEGPSHSR
ncbi:hypothetical protein GALMADRAFT_221070 [Galerina marginata CBS 339.88]|uniref:YTH domain-containing protein n=1 Tax=Galerina marginata (strain CBS 339.88) TaxID=685588 RepID=A0A067TT41_GALM3|nr:hypothetical protein GALMADRAFT_221070 [Galerina marginata CBS 339.88]